MTIVFALITIGLFIGLVLVCLSLYRQFLIRSAILENQLLLSRIKETPTQKDYRTYTLLVEHAMCQLRGKLKRVHPRQLEQLVAKEINHLVREKKITDLFLNDYSLKFGALILIPLLLGVTSGSTMNSFVSRTYDSVPLEAEAEAESGSASDLDIRSFQAYTNGIEAIAKLDWESASIELSRIHDESIYSKEAKELLRTAKKERVQKERFLQGMSALTAKQYSSAKKLLRQIPPDSLYYQEAQELLIGL